jgi:hypothetical protein
VKFEKIVSAIPNSEYKNYLQTINLWRNF